MTPTARSPVKGPKNSGTAYPTGATGGQEAPQHENRDDVLQRMSKILEGLDQKIVTMGTDLGCRMMGVKSSMSRVEESIEAKVDELSKDISDNLSLIHI